MSKNIKKLNQFNHAESFLQVNTIHGFKYIDRAGEIINEYSDGLSINPLISVDLNGLTIKEPINKVEDLKVDSYSVWMKFKEKDSLDLISSIFTKEVNKILDILDVKEISRVGWRNSFVYELANEASIDSYMKKITFIDNTSPLAHAFETEEKNDLKVKMIIQPVIKNNDEKTPGVLFDVDIFQAGKLDTKNIEDCLKMFRKYLTNQEGFLKLVNNFF